MTHKHNSTIYYPQWTSCHTVFDNTDMAYLFFDLGLYRMIPVSGKDNTLQILVNYTSTQEDGLPQEKEIDTLNIMGQAVFQALNKEFDITYLGYLASNGVCGFYFCTAPICSGKLSIAEAMVGFSGYEYSMYLLENDCWKAYTDCFFPAYQTSELIQNGMVIARFENDGDSLIKLRPVYHGFRFRKKSDRENFIATVREEGFHVENDSEENLDNDELPFRLEISRTDKVDRESVNGYTTYLWNLSYQNYGIYEGWYAEGFNDLQTKRTRN